MLAKADIKDSENKEAIGSLFYNSTLNEHWITEREPIKEGDSDYSGILSDQWREHEINPDTLKYSLDNGESWYSEEELKNVIFIAKDAVKFMKKLAED